MVMGDKKAYNQAVSKFEKAQVKQEKDRNKFIGYAPEKREFKAREKSIGGFVSNLSKGGGKAKATRTLNLSITGNRRY